MKGTISDEIEVNVPANVAWELYGTLHLSRFIVQELPTLLDKVEVIEGDGSTGTVLKITFPQGKTVHKLVYCVLFTHLLF